MDRYRAILETKEEIKCYWTKNDGVQMASLRVSLLCPITLKRIKRAVKGQACRHLQCFDLQSFLKINDKRPSLKCPICARDVPVKEVVFDRFFAQILSSTKSLNVRDVEIAEDGSYRHVEEERNANKMNEVMERMNASDSDDDVIVID
ncbi:hypothetical protein L596_005884 [Steinernema carpocapsae]|uniref:SP-RING-type domain-containing protein n=1 Tax=Steinernema carpocapsae TaxID=34508 RepID=A0A4U8V1Q4_STECR|nr:hypothetical protein L596_005884 [Steinernema carpocapsae]